MYFIFRKADGIVLYESFSLEQYANEKVACLASEGGRRADYIYLTAETSTPPGMVATPTSDGFVRFIEDPTVTASNAAKADTAKKLRALGLEDSDIKTLGLFTNANRQ